ncbi:ubiquinol-cytochrome c reductase complex assembly factor 4 isoform X2 [Halichoeres trimaculatus]|uniref:ubiquinol-cytochrome c reductase complex assembly factor 4 isoform X2 n=1 Tax=Halichoeres trimaculatus TaxID=147232 RepID=UPI003D9E5866
MSTTAGRVFNGLIRAASCRGISFQRTSAVRLSSVRALSLSTQRAARPIDDEEEVKDEPIKFSTSKASHRTWKVDRSLGSQHERPWWKVLPISLLGCAFLLWCALRTETEVDAKLERQLNEQLPGLYLDEEEEEKSSS